MNVRFQFFFFKIGCILNCLGPSFHCFPCFNFDIDCNSNDGLQCSCSCIARDGCWKCVEPTTDCYFEFIGEGDGRWYDDELHEAVDEAINAYTLMVITMQTTVMNDLYFTDQFCGFNGSFGLSHVTIFASTVVSDCSSFVPPTRNSFGGGSWISSPPYRSKCSSPREVICSMCICGDAASLPNSSSCFVTSELYEIGLELGVCWDMIHLLADDVEKYKWIRVPFIICRLGDAIIRRY